MRGKSSRLSPAQREIPTSPSPWYLIELAHGAARADTAQRKAKRHQFIQELVWPCPFIRSLCLLSLLPVSVRHLVIPNDIVRSAASSINTCRLISTLKASQICTLTTRLSCGSYAGKLFTSSDEAILQTAVQCGR